MTKVTLLKTAFNGVWPTGSEVQPIIIKAEDYGRIQTNMVQEELRVLHLMKAASGRLTCR